MMVTIHGSDFRLAMDQSSFLKRIFLYVCKKANHLHCVSDGMKREIEGVGNQRGKDINISHGYRKGFSK